MNDLSTWLYSENEAFLKDKTTLPSNSDEIMSNLRVRYGVIDLPFWRRIIHSLLSFILFVVLLVGTILVIEDILLGISNQTITFIDLGLNAMFVVSGIVGAYLFSYTTFSLIAHRQKSVEKSWSDLLSKGILLEGKVTSITAVRWGERKLEYKFSDSEGRRRRGHYYLTRLSLSVRISDKVVVWYVHDKLHTLL